MIATLTLAITLVTKVQHPYLWLSDHIADDKRPLHFSEWHSFVAQMRHRNLAEVAEMFSDGEILFKEFI